MRCKFGAVKWISIHALLAESDNNVMPAYAACGISIHALLAESDEASRGITPKGCNFYPRSPCGERRDLVHIDDDSIRISIHALLAESDRKGFAMR